MRQMAEGMGKGSEKLYPQMQSTGVLTLEEMAESIAHGSSFTTGDVKGLVDALADEIAQGVARGKTVQLEGIGSFRASLTLAETAEEELPDSETHRNAGSVRIDGVRFRCANALAVRANGYARLERVMPRKKGAEAEVPTLDERLALVRQFLGENPWMTVRDYARLTRQSAATAARELRTLRDSEDSFLTTRGRGPHKVYVLRDGETA